MCNKPETAPAKEYECSSCGKYKPMDWHNLQRWVDQLEPLEALVCDDCLRRGWTTWGRGA